MITVFTPAYNRAHSIHRVYDSLKAQTYHEFEWIIVDDGSSDNTEEVIKTYMAHDNFFEIRYFYQQNQGKHIATNRAVQEARGEMFITIDSDDGCKPQALEHLMAIWQTIPEKQKKLYKGVSCRCCKPETPDEIIGTHLKGDMWRGYAYIDSNDHDLRYIYRVKGELWGMTRREVMLENPYPEIKGLHFYPEGVYWGKIGSKYMTRYFDEPLRYYYIDGNTEDNQLTKRVNENESYYAREYMLSAGVLRRYFKYDPINFLKQAVGFTRDGFLIGKSVTEMLKTASETKRGYFLCLCSLPIGKYLQVTVQRNRKKNKEKTGY